MLKLAIFTKKNVAVSQKGYKIRYVPVDLNRTTALASESPLIVSFCKWNSPRNNAAVYEQRHLEASRSEWPWK